MRGNSMLGLNVAKMAGVELTDYYLWLDKYLSDIYVMHAPKIYVDKAGEPHSEIPEEYTEVMDTYRTIVRNIVYGKNDLFEKHR